MTGMLIKQLRIFNCRINLRGPDTGVTQHLLNRPQISAPAEQVSGKGMAQ